MRFWPDAIPLTRTQRDFVYLLYIIFRWVTCKHEKSYWSNGVDGYKCPVCKRSGYAGSPFYDPGFRGH